MAMTVGEGAAVSADFGTFVAAWIDCIAIDVGDGVGKDSGQGMPEGTNVKVDFDRFVGVGVVITSCVAASSTDGVTSCPGIVEHEGKVRPTTKMIRIALGDKKGLLMRGFRSRHSLCDRLLVTQPITNPGPGVWLIISLTHLSYRGCLKLP